MKQHLHTSKCVYLFYESPDKDGFWKKPEEQKNFESLTFKQKVGYEFKLWKSAMQQAMINFKDQMVTGPRLILHEHQLEPVWRFTGNPEELKKWIVSTDSDHSIGHSTAELCFTQYSKGLFHGFLDTRLPSDGRIKNTGFCNAKLLPSLSPFCNRKQYNWDLYTHLVFHIRGDGRVYSVNLHSQRHSDITQYDTWHYFIWTRGGPYWQYVRIPFSKFFFAYKGRVQIKNENVSLNEIGSISFTIADKISGPFHLEIDYIAVEYDPSHIEETAYEHYYFDQMFH
ncbi:complex I intermediate-associated protein 30, mitochondrial isoform X2 [Phymastichus coffea]|nr:complex I intermediate-associated protein 30, mitochondrial isoform X2 [Phymastichus coffea]